MRKTDKRQNPSARDAIRGSSMMRRKRKSAKAEVVGDTTEQARGKFEPAKLHTSTRLRYALCDADGRPALIAHDPALCLQWFADMGDLLEYSEPRQFDVMVRAGWSIRHIETTVLTGKSIENFASYRKVMVSETQRSSKNGALA